MIITKEVELQFDTNDFDINEFDFDFDEIKELVENLSDEEQKKIALSIIEKRNHKEIKDMFASVLENLSIEEAKELIKELDSEFLSLEEYRQRALQLQRSSK